MYYKITNFVLKIKNIIPGYFLIIKSNRNLIIINAIEMINTYCTLQIFQFNL